MTPKKSPANQKVGKAVRAKHRAQGYSQERYAARCELDRSYLGAIERDEFNDSLDTLVKLAGGLETTVSAIFGAAEI